MKIIKPANLNIASIHHESPSRILNFKPDCAYLIVHTIINAYSFNEVCDLGYVDIPAHIFKKIHDKYKDYLAWLKERRIILVNKSFSPGNCRSYRLGPDYCYKDFIGHCLKDNVMKKRYNKVNFCAAQAPLLKVFLEVLKKIEVDSKSAHINLRNALLSPTKTNDDDFSLRKYFIAKVTLFNIVNKKLWISRDTNVKRIHHTFTNAPKLIRPYLSLNKHKLISIDLSNSQPLFLTLLLNKSFWDKILSDTFKKELVNYLGLRVKENRLYVNLDDDNLSPSYIIIPDLMQSIDGKNFRGFVEAVENGCIYEFIQQESKSILGMSYASRDHVKKAVLMALYSDNRFIQQTDAKLKRLFKQTFPEVYEVMRIIKRTDKRILPTLLQRIESYMFIEKIAKRIVVELPSVEFFTIHDNIVVESENVFTVTRIIHEELKSFLGVKAPLKTEVWSASRNENLAAS